MTNLWLGSEYNQNYQDTESTDSLMRQYLKFGKINKNTSFFERLEAQVSCFGNPNDFHYDDLSRIKATGKQSEKNQYESNVKASVNHQINLFNELNPKIILIGGDLPFKAWRKLILPHLKFDTLTVVKMRNPSPEGHRGNAQQWNDKYCKFKADLSNYTGLNLLHLKCSNIRLVLTIKNS